MFGLKTMKRILLEDRSAPTTWLAGVLLSVALGGTTQASVVTYSTQAAYDAATGANQTFNFAGQGAGHKNYIGTTYTDTTYPNITFTSNTASLYILNPNYYRTTGYSTDYLNNNSSCCLTINFNQPIYGFAAEIGSVANFGSAPSPTVTVDVGGVNNTITLPGYAAYSSLGPTFFGLSSTSAFTSLTIDSPTNGLTIESVDFSTNAFGAPGPSAGVGLFSLAFLVVAGAAGQTSRRSAR